VCVCVYICLCTINVPQISTQLDRCPFGRDLICHVHHSVICIITPGGPWPELLSTHLGIAWVSHLWQHHLH
jgi:hypothetical protein